MIKETLVNITEENIYFRDKDNNWLHFLQPIKLIQHLLHQAASQGVCLTKSMEVKLFYLSK